MLEGHTAVHIYYFVQRAREAFPSCEKCTLDEYKTTNTNNLSVSFLSLNIHSASCKKNSVKYQSTPSLLKNVNSIVNQPLGYSTALCQNLVHTLVI